MVKPRLTRLQADIFNFPIPGIGVHTILYINSYVLLQNTQITLIRFDFCRLEYHPLPGLTVIQTGKKLPLRYLIIFSHIHSGTILRLNQKKILEARFLKSAIFFQVRHWQWLLDTGLPGEFGQIGEWLNQAEGLVYGDDIPTQLNEESAAVLNQKIEVN